MVNIILDGQPLDFTLEDEKTLYDIYSSVQKWLDVQGGEILAFETEGNKYTHADREVLSRKSLQDVETVDITTRGKRERIFEEMKIILDFFQLLHSAMINNESGSVSAILEEYPFVRSSLSLYLSDLFLTEEGPAKAFDTYHRSLTEDKLEAAEASKKAAMDFIQLVVSILKDRLQEIKEPARESFAVGRLLLNAKTSVENVAILLQTGRDREAMQTVLSFIEIVLKALRILGFRDKQDEEIKEFCREFNGVLNELTSAFSLKDSVLIGDLLEYEISPRIGRLAELLQSESAV